MALSASTVWEVRTTGSDTNGGGFKAGASGTDYSQQDAAQLSVTDAACTGNTTVTSATGGFTSAMIGNIIYLSSGPGWYEITARTDTNTITIDRNGPNASGMTANVGGALATLPTLASVMTVTGQKAFVKSGGGYTITSTLIFGNGYTATIFLEGYTTTRGDNGRVTITFSGSGIYVYVHNYGGIRNFIIDCALQTSSSGIHLGNYTYAHNCKVMNYKIYGFDGGAAGGRITECEVTGGGSGATVGINNAEQVFGCYIHDNVGGGILIQGGVGTVSRNIVANNTGAGIAFVFEGPTALSNTIYGNGGNGIQILSTYDARVTLCRNNIIANNGGYGLIHAGSTAQPALPQYDGNAYYNNTSGNRNKLDDTTGINGVAPYTNILDVILTADPFTNAAGGDFTLNNTAGGGAACRGTGTPGSLPGISQVGYPDMGALQHQETSSGGLFRPVGTTGGLV